MSTIPTVRAALVTVLDAALPTVQVVDGPGVTTLADQVLWIGRIDGKRAGGTQNRIFQRERNAPYDTYQDEYTIELIISVKQSGAGETTTVMTIADQLYNTARIAIEDSYNLGLDGDDGVYEVLPTGDFTFEPEADANGRYVTVTFGVDVTARD